MNNKIICYYVHNFQKMLYYLGRLFAIFIFGPLLVLFGKQYNNKILLWLGILLIIWDGAKLIVQHYFNDFSEYGIEYCAKVNHLKENQ
jgi:hypothetical protein